MRDDNCTSLFWLFLTTTNCHRKLQIGSYRDGVGVLADAAVLGSHGCPPSVHLLGVDAILGVQVTAPRRQGTRGRIDRLS